MKYLITSDLHLTDRPRDECRFGLFPWLAKQQKLFQPQATFILGDVTDKKDKHSSKLVNRIIDELIQLKPPIFILAGNHDGVDPDNPFFRFVNCIDGINLIVDPEEVLPGVFMIPHRRTQQEFDRACGIIKPKPTMVMVHATFEGAIAETGARLSGLNPAAVELKQPKAALAGDVHKPQRTGLITYLGAPYHVRFGDHFKPRVLLIDSGAEKNLYFDSPRKWALTIKDADDLERNSALRKGDQVKLTIRLTRDEIVEWAAHKQRCLAACQNLGLEVFGIELEAVASERKDNSPSSANTQSDKDVLLAYCKAEKAGAAIRAAGVELLDV